MHHSWFGPVTRENGSEHGVVRFLFFCGLVKPARLKMLPNVLAAGHTRSGCSISSLALSFRAPQEGCLARSTRMVFSTGSRVGVSVPGHALRCGPETSATSPLRWRWFELSGHERTYIQPSRPWECGNPEGISTECGKGGKPASWLSMLSILCHFHDLLFARHCWINRNATQRHAPRSPRTKIPAHWRKWR